MVVRGVQRTPRPRLCRSAGALFILAEAVGVPPVAGGCLVVVVVVACGATCMCMYYVCTHTYLSRPKEKMWNLRIPRHPSALGHRRGNIAERGPGLRIPSEPLLYDSMYTLYKYYISIYVLCTVTLP